MPSGCRARCVRAPAAAAGITGGPMFQSLDKAVRPRGRCPVAMPPGASSPERSSSLRQTTWGQGAGLGMGRQRLGQRSVWLRRLRRCLNSHTARRAPGRPGGRSRARPGERKPGGSPPLRSARTTRRAYEGAFRRLQGWLAGPPARRRHPRRNTWPPAPKHEGSPALGLKA